MSRRVPTRSAILSQKRDRHHFTGFGPPVVASTLPVAWPPAGMTRDEIRTALEHANSDYDIIVTFNDDDTIRSISGVRYSGRVDVNLTKPC